MIRPRFSIIRATIEIGASIAVYVVLVACCLAARGEWRWLAVPTGALSSLALVRVYVMQHDLGHNSLFPRYPRLTSCLGTLCSFLTLTPFAHWRKAHNLHHKMFGDLGRRREADVFPLTVAEFRRMPAWKRIVLRVAMARPILLAIIPLFVFLVRRRFNYLRCPPTSQEARSVAVTNIAVVAIVALVGWSCGAIGLLELFAIFWASTIVGGFLFVTQHMFPRAVYFSSQRWTFREAALAGSSWLKLPEWLDFLTARIGRHHLHHVDPGVPGYLLARAQELNPTLLPRGGALSLGEAIRSTKLVLWDEARGRLVTFRDLAQ